MNTLNCIIIEDQIPAQKTLQAYIEQVPYLHLLDTFISPIEATAQLENKAVDLIFLDIHLPKINGIDFLSSLHHPPHIILTTAFSEYAVKGFELDVVDYLLKPYSFQRFLKAILKIKQIPQQTTRSITNKHLFIKSKQRIEKITINTIQYIESKGDFVRIHTLQGALIATITMQQILEKLGNKFCRCHKSYIVNIEAIEKIRGNRIMIDSNEIPIGRTFKEQLLGRIDLI